MPRKTQIRKSKGNRGTRRMHKRMSISKKYKTRKYRGKGGCANGTCSCESTPQWTSKGGNSDLISKDINNYVTDKTFYSSVY